MTSMTSDTTTTDPPITRPWRRWLRITWSVFFAVVTVALCVLWIRSYLRTESLEVCIGGQRELTALSIPGVLMVGYGPGLDSLASGKYLIASEPIDMQYVASMRMELGLGGFGAINESIWWIFAAPYWFLVTSTTTVAVLSWTRWSKRFSLRTMLIATTLIAAVLGAVVWTLGR